MKSAVSFAPLRPADFVNFAGRGKACFLRGGAGGAACFSAGRGVHPWREGRYQAGPKGRSLEVGARRAPRLLVIYKAKIICEESQACCALIYIGASLIFGGLSPLIE